MSPEYRQLDLFEHKPPKQTGQMIPTFRGKPLGIATVLPGKEKFLEELFGPPRSNLEVLIHSFREQEIRMAKDMNPHALYHREAISWIIWAFQQGDINHPLARDRVGIGRFFGAVVDYYAIYTGFASSQTELGELSDKPCYPRAYPWTPHPKKLTSPQSLNDSAEVAFIHGKFSGGFSHPEHIQAIQDMAKLKLENPRLKVVVGVDSAWVGDLGYFPLITPLFSCSTLAQIGDVDFVYEIPGPYDTTWTGLFTKDNPRIAMYQIDRQAWSDYYERLYRQLKVRYLHVRTDQGNAFAAEQLDRCHQLGIIPIVVERNELAYSDSILRDSRRLPKTLSTGLVVYDDFEDEAEDMAREIVFKLIPELEKQKQSK